MLSLRWKHIILWHNSHPDNIALFLAEARNISMEGILKDTIHDPFLLPDSEKAVTRILWAHKNKERVMIFGDYDVDGVSSTAALFLFLRDELKMDVSYRLPHRVRDGYGMKVYHIDEIVATGAKLLITVDCGTRDIEPIQRATELGLDVIVTDHHTCPAILPDCVAIVNPKRSDSLYPFTGLSWSGVVWKLINALLLRISYDKWVVDKEIIETTLMKYVDIVALGTVADCMPMVDENRTIVRRGLIQSRNSHHPFFQVFSHTLNRPLVTEDDIGFFVWPMLNAGWRITTPYQSISALLASSEDAYTHIQRLMTVNETRKVLSRDAYERALTTIDMTTPCILYVDETLTHGIIWLVAGKLCELLHRPIGVFTRDHDNYVGSFRAPTGIDIVTILDASSKYIMRYGGHASAAGCTIAVKHFPQAHQAIVEATERLYTLSDFVPTITVDSIIDIEEVDQAFMQQIESLRPFWQWFQSPLFMIQNISWALSALGSTGEHIKWDIGNKNMDIVGFHMGDLTDTLSSGHMHLIGKLTTRVWRDTITTQFHVIDAVKV